MAVEWTCWQTPSGQDADDVVTAFALNRPLGCTPSLVNRRPLASPSRVLPASSKQSKLNGGNSALSFRLPLHNSPGAWTSEEAAGGDGNEKSENDHNNENARPREDDEDALLQMAIRASMEDHATPVATAECTVRSPNLGDMISTLADMNPCLSNLRSYVVQESGNAFRPGIGWVGAVYLWSSCAYQRAFHMSSNWWISTAITPKCSHLFFSICDLVLQFEISVWPCGQVGFAVLAQSTGMQCHRSMDKRIKGKICL